MLAKQAWRLTQDPNSLSARILRAVYYPEGDVLNVELGSHPSQVWRAVCAGLSVLKQGLIKRVGHGQSIKIWEHNWLPRDFMLRTLHPRSMDPPALVSDLIDQVTKTWDRLQVLQHMQAPNSFVILNIPISARNVDDVWAWHYECNGVFSV